MIIFQVTFCTGASWDFLEPDDLFCLRVRFFKRAIGIDIRTRKPYFIELSSTEIDDRIKRYVRIPNRPSKGDQA